MKKRLVSILLVLVMVLGMLPTVAFAAETAAPITTAEEFAAMDEGGNYILTRDITITAPYAKDFTGTFNGGGNTITLNITGVSAANVGTFSVLRSGAVVENLMTDGTITAPAYNNVGGIAGQASAATADIIIRNCKNAAAISGKQSVGGIVGYVPKNNDTSGVKMEGLANTGDLSGTRNVGGIIGNLEGPAHSLTNAYNHGNMTASGSGAAGICGRAANGFTLSNCYTTGTLTKSDGALISAGSSYNTAVAETNCYALEGCGTEKLNYQYGINATASSFKTEEEMKAADFAALLGDGFMAVPNDYPNLSWEIPSAALTAALDNADAVFTLTKGGETYYSGEGKSHNVALPEGEYAWTAACEGYFTQNGTISVSKSDAETAKPLSVNVTFVPDPNAPTVTSISVKEGSYKTDYKQGDKLDDKLTLVLHYSDGTTKEVSKGYTITGFLTEEPAEALELTVTYEKNGQTFSAKFTVSVAETPDVLKALRPYAEISFGHNDSYKGEAGKEFVYDNDEGALQSKSQDMGNSEVWVSIKLKDDAPAGNISFSYKTDSESNYDYLVLGRYAYGATKYNQTKWTQVSFSLQPGKEQLLTFRKDSSGNSGKDCVWLKDFVFAQLYALELTTVPADANVTLKDAAGKTVTGTNGKYTVPAGDYTYEASAFGYETATDTIKVTDKDVSKTITLQQLPGQTVTFDLEIPETIPAEDKNSYTITIKQGAATVRTLKGENTTTLPAGEYTYTITHPNCDDVTGSFTVSGSAVTETKTLTRKLVFSDFFADCKGITATNHERRPWKAVKDEANGNYLTTESVATDYGSSYKTTILFEAADNVRLSFDVVPYCYGSSDRFVIYKNNKSVKTYDRSDKWESYSIDLLTGDTLLLEYTPHGTTYYTRLKNFKTEKLAKVNFTLGTAGASLVFTNKETGATYEPASGASSIVLSAGTYTYTASKFGCKDETGEFTVAGGETKNITVPALTELKNATVTFHVTLPEDCKKPYTVVICKGGEIVYNETIAEDAAESCTLPVGTYTYTVSHAKCDDAAGELELAEAGGEIRVTLARKPVFEDFFANCDGIIAANSNVYP